MDSTALLQDPGQTAGLLHNLGLIRVEGSCFQLPATKSDCTCREATWDRATEQKERKLWRLLLGPSEHVPIAEVTGDTDGVVPPCKFNQARHPMIS